MVTRSPEVADGASPQLRQQLVRLNKLTRQLQEMAGSLRMSPCDPPSRRWRGSCATLPSRPQGHRVHDRPAPTPNSTRPLSTGSRTPCCHPSAQRGRPRHRVERPGTAGGRQAAAVGWRSGPSTRPATSTSRSRTTAGGWTVRPSWPRRAVEGWSVRPMRPRSRHRRPHLLALVSPPRR